MTKRQQEALELYQAGLSIKQVAARLKISRQAVSKLISKATKNTSKNARGSRGGLPPPATPPPHNGNLKEYRYHGLHIIVQPYYFFPRYHKHKGSVRAIVGDWLVLMHKARVRGGIYKGSVEFRQASTAKMAFMGKTAQEALDKAHASFERAMLLAGQRYGFAVNKQYKTNVQIVREHLAVGPSGVGRSVRSHIMVRGDNDKVWFVIDKSRDWEHEYTEAGEVRTDQAVIEPFLNDLREHPDIKLSEMDKVLREVVMLQRDTAKLQHETAAGMQVIINLMRPPVPADNEYGGDYIG